MTKHSPLDIQHMEFTTAFNGYNRRQVRDFLTVLSDQTEEMQRETQRLKDELARKEKRIQDLQSAELELKRAVIAAERIGSEMKQNAKRESEIILREANSEKSNIVKDAETRLKEARYEISRLEREQMLFREQFRGMLHAFERTLDKVPVMQNKIEQDKKKQIDASNTNASTSV